MEAIWALVLFYWTVGAVYLIIPSENNEHSNWFRLILAIKSLFVRNLQFLRCPHQRLPKTPRGLALPCTACVNQHDACCLGPSWWIGGAILPQHPALSNKFCRSSQNPCIDECPSHQQPGIRKTDFHFARVDTWDRKATTQSPQSQLMDLNFRSCPSKIGKRGIRATCLGKIGSSAFTNTTWPKRSSVLKSCYSELFKASGLVTVFGFLTMGFTASRHTAPTATVVQGLRPCEVSMCTHIQQRMRTHTFGNAGAHIRIPMLTCKL